MTLASDADAFARELDLSAASDASPMTPEILKVSAHSRPTAAAGAIAGVIREGGVAEVQSIGAGATNQAVKAIAIARSYLHEDGIRIVCVPSFTDVVIDGQERTAIRLLVTVDHGYQR